MKSFQFLVAAGEERTKCEREYQEASEKYDINSFAYFACTINGCGFVRRVHAEIVAKEGDVKVHVCDEAINSVMQVLRNHASFETHLKDKRINFTFEMMQTYTEENQPATDSDSMQAAIVASIINLLHPPKNCNWFVATGAIDSAGGMKPVQGVALKFHAAKNRNLLFVLPEANRDDIPVDQHRNCRFVETIEDLLRLVDQEPTDPAI